MMDQVKIGKFIAEMRKEQNLTQKQLADRLEISDRTISKWECGKGMPDVGLMIPLCEEIKINVNELLSGKRLSEDHYPKRAEENMIRLIEENGDKKKRELVYVLTYGLAIIMVAALLVASLYMQGFSIIYYMDLPSFLFITIMLILFLGAAGLLKDFFYAFVLAFKDKQYNKEHAYERAEQAMDLAIKVSILDGVLIFFFYLIFVMRDLGTPDKIGPNIAVAMLSILYGIFFATILLPIRARIRSKMSELKFTHKMENLMPYTEEKNEEESETDIL
ncbi:MAG: helix-turn-helix domain-containing protein [Lachnospiraceae bacterium]|nr:helix-turn-helix domain-containing protein [Lachnospiraceae bacterium]